MNKTCSYWSFTVNSVAKSAKVLLSTSLLVLAILFANQALAQSNEKQISGTVTEAESGETLPGVSIFVQGTTNGTVTSIDGTFNLTVSEDDVLQVSFVGFIAQQIPVAGKTNFTIALEPDVVGLEEVVVVGYGVQKKKLVTGATVQVDGDKLAKRSTTSALQALQGQTSGVQITSTSGQPGEGMKVVVRGQGTIGGSGPLYVIDGIQSGDISYLNNADIESIDVLKDAAAAAIYGSQAANGVILITTKSGKQGATKISFDAYYGFQNIAHKVDMLNSKEYAVIMNEANINSGNAPYFSQDEINAMGTGTDWIDEMLYDNAVTQNYTLGLTGGSDKSVYSFSMSYTGQEGIVGGPSVSNYERYNLRINTEHKLYDGLLKVGQHLTMGYTSKNGISVGNQYNNTLRGAFNTSPFLPMRDDEGNYLDNTANAGVIYRGEEWTPWIEGESNPYALMKLNNQSENNNQKVLGDVYFELTPLKNLTLRTTLGYDYYAGEGHSYSPTYHLSIYAFRDNDEAKQDMNKGLALTWDNVLTYQFTRDDHSLTAMAGNSIYRNKGTWLSVNNANLTVSDLEHAYINNTTNTDFTLLGFGGAPNDVDKRLSYFGRLSYSYQERFLLNATFRADGSSRFAKGNRWGYFPSFSAGWVMSNETFMENSFLDFLKLRASWGQVGSQNIPAFRYLALVKTDQTNYYFGSDDFDSSGNTVGAYPNTLPNPDLKWETSEQLNFGIDAQLLDNHLTINADYYEKKTKDWLIDVPVLATAGADSRYINGGDVKNTGIELSMTYANKVGDLSYNINANVSKNKNEVTEVPTNDGIVHGLPNMLYDNSLEFYHRAETGYPIGYFWGWETNGLFQNEAEVQNYVINNKVVQPKAKPGDLRYVDQNNDGVIDESDKTMVGAPNPDYIFGFSLGLNYKAFDFLLAANGVAGNQIVQSYRNHVVAKANYTTEILNRWHGEGTSNKIPRVTNNNINYLFSDVFVKDGDYLRISNITLGYDFARSLVQHKYISQLRLYASVQNAFTFTKYNGMDPEVGYGVEDGSSGVDLGYYPNPRTVMIGVNVKF
nr:TonB-dependent receptor [uncultured Draconibacterium sp.]